MNWSRSYIFADKKMTGFWARSLKLSLLFSFSPPSGLRSSPSLFSLCERSTVTSGELEDAQGRGRKGPAIHKVFVPY